MKQYHELLEDILENGISKGDRTGAGTLSVFGRQYRYNLSEGKFPLLTTKKVSFKNIVVECLWFLRGNHNIAYMVQNGCNIWNEDAYRYYQKVYPTYTGGSTDGMLDFKQFVKAVKEGKQTGTHIKYNYGDTGYQYPKMWREWKGINVQHKGVYKIVDQIEAVIESLKKNPDSRRHIVTAYDPAHQDDCALPPCHTLFQFYTRELTTEQRLKLVHDNLPDIHQADPHNVAPVLDNMGVPKYYLDCKLTQRSLDTLLGCPYNIASYSLLTHIIARICNMIPGDFIHDIGDAHIYKNHIEAAKEQLQRDPNKYPLPKLEMSDTFHYSVDAYNAGRIDLDTLINGWTPEDFRVKNYQSYPKLENSTELNTGLNK